MDALHGIVLVMKTPRLWPLCFGPLVAAFLFYLALGVAGGLLLLRRLPDWLGATAGSRNWWVVEIAGGAAAVVLWWFLFSFFFVLLAGMFSGLLWERLAREVEVIEGGQATGDVALGCGALALDSVARILVNAVLGVNAILLSLVAGPIPGIAAAAIAGLLDYTSPAYLRRGRTLGPQVRDLLRRADAQTLVFALLVGVLSLVPLLGVLLMPGFVAGGALMVRRREAAAKPR